MGGDCDIDRYLVVVKVSEVRTVSEQTTHKFYIARFNRKKVNEIGVEEHCPVEI
jgi:hypothetical protein